MSNSIPCTREDIYDFDLFTQSLSTGQGVSVKRPQGVVSLGKWFMAARSLSLCWSNRLQLMSQSMQARREVNLLGGWGGAGNVILEYGMTPNTQHLETLSDGRVGSASFNLSQCKVILLWLPGAYPSAQTHTNRFIRWHMVILVKECIWCFIYNWFLISRYVDNRFIGLRRQNIPFWDSGTARWKLFTRNTAQLYKDVMSDYSRRSWKGKSLESTD